MGNRLLAMLSAAVFLSLAISAAKADLAFFPPVDSTNVLVAGGMVVAIIIILVILGIRQSRGMNKTGKNAAK